MLLPDLRWLSKNQGLLMQPHFRVAISYSCEGPREQRWKCLRCGGGGRKFRKESRVTRLLVKQVEEVGSRGRVFEGQGNSYSPFIFFFFP